MSRKDSLSYNNEADLPPDVQEAIYQHLDPTDGPITLVYEKAPTPHLYGYDNERDMLTGRVSMAGVESRWRGQCKIFHRDDAAFLMAMESGGVSFVVQIESAGQAADLARYLTGWAKRRRVADEEKKGRNKT